MDLYEYQDKYRFYMDEVEMLRNKAEIIDLINNPLKVGNKPLTYEKLIEMKNAIKPY